MHKKTEPIGEFRRGGKSAGAAFTPRWRSAILQRGLFSAALRDWRVASNRTPVPRSGLAVACTGDCRHDEALVGSFRRRETRGRPGRGGERVGKAWSGKLGAGRAARGSHVA